MRLVLTAMVIALAVVACGKAHADDNRTGDGLPAVPTTH
jgi:multisubunit Na+/H+ antiporter MnhC subunit